MKIRDRIKELRRVKAGELRPNPRNWRTHPVAQQDALRGVLAEVGYASALLARQADDGGLVLIDGHLRAETTPDSEVPVLVLDVSEAEADKLLATFDPLAAMAEADSTKLDALLRSIDTGSEALQGMLAELAKDNGLYKTPEITEDEVPEPPVDPVTKPGDLWLLGEHRLLCGDSTKAEDVERVMLDEKAVLMNTDPPYGVDYHGLKKGMDGFNSLKRDGAIENDELTSGPELQAFLEQMIRVAIPHMVANPAFYFWHPMLTQGTFFAAAAAADILIHRQIVWVKPRLVLTRSGMYHWQHELCFYGWIRGKPCLWAADKKQTSVWNCGEALKGRLHPTQKPVELFTRPINNHTREGEVVYEPFSGSGPQFSAAEQLNRRCYGLEISPAYCDVIVERWEKLTGGKAVRDG